MSFHDMFWRKFASGTGTRHWPVFTLAANALYGACRNRQPYKALGGYWRCMMRARRRDVTDEHLRLVVVDDHPLFAEALAARLSSEPDLEVPVVAERVDEAIAVIARERPGVILLDHMLGQHSGLAVLRAVRQSDPDAKVVMLSARSEVDQVVRAIRLGARAWVPKSGDVGQLIYVIRSVARGRSWLPEDLIGPVLDRLIEPDQQADVLAVLTSREREVLSAMIDGLTRADIARELCLSPNTVRTHAQNLLAKLDCHSVLQVVALARRHGMQPNERITS